MVSTYKICIPPALRALDALSEILAKGEAHCTARSIDPAVMLQSRLYPDMFALTRQVQIASDSASRMGARIAGVAAPVMPDTETSFGELRERLTTTAKFLRALKPEAFEGGEDREVVVPVRGGELRMSGLDYFQAHAMPNLLFHAATAYAILRHNGVELGKKDFLGPMPIQQ